MSLIERIYLTGFMGAGKSTVAPRVARGMGFTSVDLDREITNHLGMSVPSIFDVLGESAFREQEAACLQKMSQRNSVVVSLGGGSLSQPGNLATCLNSGLVVYLRGSVDYLAYRLSKSRHTRPLLFSESGEMLEGTALTQRISELLTARQPIYEQAHIIVDIDQRKAREVAREVIEHCRTWDGATG